MTTASTQVLTVRAGALEGFDAVVRRLGGDPAPILRRCGLTLAELNDSDRHVPHRAVVEAIEEAGRALRTRDFGLRLCAAQDVGFLGMLALVIQSASSVREGMLLGVRYIHLHAPALGFRVLQSEDGLRESMEAYPLLDGLAEMPQVDEHAVGHMCRLISLLSDGELRPAAIHFRHARQGSEAQYRRHLGQLPHFGAAFNGFSVDPLAWRRPTPQRNRQMRQFVARFLQGLAPSRALGLVEQVRAVQRHLLRVGRVDLACVARTLDLHPRTLQRRLRSEGAEFGALLDDERKAWAADLLGQRALALVDVAAMLGFANPSVLTHACRRWFGTTPSRWREVRASE